MWGGVWEYETTENGGNSPAPLKASGFYIKLSLIVDKATFWFILSAVETDSLILKEGGDWKDMRNVIRYRLILLCGLLGLSSNLAIADMGIISGRVIDASSLASIAGANINTKPYGPSTTTDINGDYTMGDLPIGDYLVMVSATGYIPISKLITLALKQARF